MGWRTIDEKPDHEFKVLLFEEGGDPELYLGWFDHNSNRWRVVGIHENPKPTHWFDKFDIST